MNQSNQSFKTLFDEVVQHLEIEFSDYEFRKPLLEKQLNNKKWFSKGYREIKQHVLLILEIKEYRLRKITFQNKQIEPQYSGKCYKSVYVGICYKRMKQNKLFELQEKIKYVEQIDFNQPEEKIRFNYINQIFTEVKIKNKYDLRYFIDCKKNPNYELNKELYNKELKESQERVFTDIEYKVYTEDLRKSLIEGLQLEIENEKIRIQRILGNMIDINNNNPKYNLCNSWFNYTHYHTDKKYTGIQYCSALKSFKDKYDCSYVNKTEKQYIKIRRPIEIVDYKESIFSYYNAINIKYWDKKTGKTNNKGLRATHYRDTYEDSDGKSRINGWIFGGIKIDDIKDFCKLNGYKTSGKDKKTIEKEYKKHTYGDMACWIFKTLE